MPTAEEMESSGGRWEEPNIRISSALIYMEEMKQLMQKEGRGSFFFTCKIFISDRLVQQRLSGEQISSRNGQCKYLKLLRRHREAGQDKEERRATEVLEMCV